MDSRIARIARVVLWISSMVVTYFVGVQVGSQAKPPPVAVAPEVKAGSSRVGSALGTRSEAMTDLIRERPAAEANEAVDSMGYSLMWSKPEKGAAFLVETATPEALPARYAMIVSAWANRNPNDAGAWLNRQPPGPAQDAARATFARTVVRKDPESAFAWARSVTESEQRTNALRDVIQVWSARDAKAANQALAASGLGAKEIQAIQGGRQN
jgi:hypothetical protein